MQTLRLTIDLHDLNDPRSQAAIETGAAILRGGGTVAFPTETVYGLGANALDAAAVAKIFEAKQRPAWDPLIVHVSDQKMLERVVTRVAENALRLIDAFWPGPLTLLLPRNARVPEIVTAGRPLVGVRMPQHPVAHALVQAADLPIAAPSANSFGRTSPTQAIHVLEDLDGRIDAVLDGGETTHGLESTVVEAGDERCIVYRPGVITLEQIRAVCADAVAYNESPLLSETLPESLPSPGVGIRHYAPRARLILIEAQESFTGQQRAFEQAVAGVQGERLGLMLPEGFEPGAAGSRALIYRWGSWRNLEELAQRLFAGLRWLDSQGATVILCPLPQAKGVGIAIRDRLRKAARS
jgi:L-threonylcarbamoyladenylate synthase